MHHGFAIVAGIQKGNHGHPGNYFPFDIGTTGKKHHRSPVARPWQDSINPIGKSIVLRRACTYCSAALLCMHPGRGKNLISRNSIKRLSSDAVESQSVNLTSAPAGASLKNKGGGVPAGKRKKKTGAPIERQRHGMIVISRVKREGGPT
ncbi:hypothetical protein KM043_018394 [Ampulex compressa]|nr:hypothetical protein KM043_018394 [Ampulex compressa]